MPGRRLLTFVLAALVCPAAAYAQSQSPETDGVAPAHVALVEGTASLEREGRAENSPLNMPLLSGDRLRTVDGRVEVLFADGSTLHLDQRSTIDVQSDDLVRLTEGRVRLNILGPVRTVAYRIDSPAGSARIIQPGEYRIALLRGEAEIQLEIAVVRGTAEIFTDQGSTPVRAGERAYASAGLAPSYAYSYNSANWDAFDRWSEARRDVRLGVSSQYLPSEMQAYAPLLDESGDWRYTQSYGYAWYPRVTTEWRPYYYGRWASYPRYGWTWIGADRFAWPTHHYGRWGFSAGVWFWIPSSRWAPAYVSWAYAPGYVSWCPLGFDNRPIIAIDLYRVGPGYYSPWRAWTAVSYSHFGGRGYSVHQRAVNWDRVDRGQRPRFETRPSAPGFSRDIAVPRSSTPIRWAGSRDVPSSPGRDVAVPRAGTAPRYVNRGDEIIRSQTGRPTPRAASPTTSFNPSRASGSPRAESGGDGAQGRSAREGSAVPRDATGGVAPRHSEGRGGQTRTMPDGPARPARPDSEAVATPRGYEPSERVPSYRPFDPSRASGSPRAEPRGDGTQGRPYQPSVREVPPRSTEPTPSRQPMPERAAPAERAPSRGQGAERAPSRGEGRQPPAERAAPSGSAVPRGSGGAAPRPRGRGGL